MSHPQANYVLLGEMPPLVFCPPVTHLVSTKKANTALDPEFPRSSSWVVKSGMTPSVEMRLLREARRSARVAAEASGTGRRARAPSLKLLEATGVIKSKSMQWMTKEIKQETTRLKHEQVMQLGMASLTEEETAEAHSEPNVGGGGGKAEKASNRSGSSYRGESNCLEGNHGTGGLLFSKHKHTRQQSTTAKIPQEIEKGSTTERATDSNRKGENPFMAVARENIIEPPKKRAWVVSGDTTTGAKRNRSTLDKRDDARKPKQGNRERRDQEDIRDDDTVLVAEVTKGAGNSAVSGAETNEASGRINCEHGGCPAAATFGVNGTVRYW